MSKLARTLVLGATLAAINLTGAVAQAQSNDESTSTQDARRPPSQGQVGEAWRQPRLQPSSLPWPATPGGPDREPSGGVLAPSGRRPGAAGRAERPVRLAGRVARGASRRSGAGGRAGNAGRQTGRPQGWAWHAA